MLNYIAAELYKFNRRQGLFAAMALLLILEVLVFVPEVMLEDLREEPEACLLVLEACLLLGLFLAPIFAIRVFDDQYGYGTMKNEVVFGMPRSRVYLGKLLTAMLTGTVAAAVAVGWYLLLTVLSTGSIPLVLWVKAFCSIGVAWLTWLSVLSYTFFLLTVLKSTVGAVLISYFTTLFGSVFSVALSNSDVLWKRLLGELFYTSPYGLSVLWNDTVWKTGTVAHPMLYALLVALIWGVGLSALGLFLFQRKEIS